MQWLKVSVKGVLGKSDFVSKLELKMEHQIHKHLW